MAEHIINNNLLLEQTDLFKNLKILKRFCCKNAVMLQLQTNSICSSDELVWSLIQSVSS